VREKKNENGNGIIKEEIVRCYEEKKIGYCGNIGCGEPASRHSTKERAFHSSYT